MVNIFLIFIQRLLLLFV